jgi:hypothetical protein
MSVGTYKSDNQHAQSKECQHGNGDEIGSAERSRRLGIRRKEVPQGRVGVVTVHEKPLRQPNDGRSVWRISSRGGR